jgi:hypothetical protein
VSFFVNLCTFCRHRGVTTTAGPTCAAFPDGIPQAVWEMRADHRLPYPGDQGIRFEAADPAAAARWFPARPAPASAEDIAAARG